MVSSSVRDGFSLSLGLISVVSWVVAEIPQIMTNYKDKSTEGISIAFLSTWMIGDMFNIAGCLMEPATLPTQLYMAVLYTVATAVLYVQSIYYGHIYPRLMNRRKKRTLEEPLLPPSTNKPTLCVVSTFLFLGMLNLLSSESRSMDLGEKDRVFVVQGGRKLLEATSINLGELDNSRIGMWLGWGMAVIYSGGRIPQICLNMRRGHVEGLNPLMFFFALLGNLTYVASILVKSMEWCKIAPNLPWLVEAGGCVVLDLFILLQWFHLKDKYRDKKMKMKKHETAEEAV